MHVLITGGSGFIGRHLTGMLIHRGHTVTIADKNPPGNSGVEYIEVDCMHQPITKTALGNADAIIHLAGRNIFSRWTTREKQLIYDTRIVTTRNIVTQLAELEQKPEVFISASAVGYYGNRGEEELDESSKSGNDFLAKVCIDWEKEAREAEALGIRTVQVRTAPVLGPGGFLTKMLPAFKIGLGGPLGNGAQWFPWIHMEDIAGAYTFALEHDSLHGPINACAPHQVRNKEFSRVLGEILDRPASIQTPRWALRILFGDLADFMLASQKVRPAKLLEAAYQFQFPHLDKAIEDTLRMS